MDTIDISKLRRDDTQNDLYDLFIQSFSLYNSNLSYVIVDKQYEMRLDYLCSDLLGSIEYIGFLMKLNDIFNPYSIKVGDIIIYVPSSKINEALYKDPKALQTQAKALVNTIKKTNIDSNRTNFLDKLNVSPKLPPIVDTNGSPKNVISDTSIKIAPTLFTKPNRDVNTDNNGLGDIFNNTGNTGNTGNTDNIGNTGNADSTGNTDNTERILVNTFIRTNNVIIDKTNTDDNAS